MIFEIKCGVFHPGEEEHNQKSLNIFVPRNWDGFIFDECVVGNLKEKFEKTSGTSK